MLVIVEKTNGRRFSCYKPKIYKILNLELGGPYLSKAPYHDKTLFTYLCEKLIAELLRFFISRFLISEIELLSSERSDFIELAFISEVLATWTRCEELCIL